MTIIRSDRACLECGVQHIIQLPEHINEVKFNFDLRMVRDHGRYIQEELYYLTEEQREMLITGYCQKAWDKLFNDEE